MRNSVIGSAKPSCRLIGQLALFANITRVLSGKTCGADVPCAIDSLAACRESSRPRTLLQAPSSAHGVVVRVNVALLGEPTSKAKPEPESNGVTSSSGAPAPETL